MLITGGSGFVGKHLIDYLEHGGSQIAVLAPGRHDGCGSRIRQFDCDIRDSSNVRLVLREFQPETIFHLAGISDVQSSWKNPRLTYEVNFWGALNLFEAAANLHPPPRILNVSTAQVYASSSGALSEAHSIQPDNPYSASKAMAELLMVQSRKQAAGGIVTARAFNHTGPGQSERFVVSSIAKQFAEIQEGVRLPQIQVGNLEVRRDFCDVRDVVRAYVLLLEHGTIGEIYNVCSGMAMRLSDIVVEFEAISGLKVEIESDPGKVRSREVDQVCGDPRKIRAATGWRPEIPLRRTLSDLLEYWRAGISTEMAQTPATER
jgi:GDP-4-dehydro-6-deoxy-D-mannose reductase